jgi:hypothetical protein
MGQMLQPLGGSGPEAKKNRQIDKQDGLCAELLL